MKKFLLVFLLVFSVVLFSGCTGGGEKTSEKNMTVDKVTESNNAKPKDIQVSEIQNITAETEGRNSTVNPVKENNSISKTLLVEMPLAKGFARYTDDIFGFSVDYPETWEQGGVGGLGGRSFNPVNEDSTEQPASIFVTVYSNESEAKPWIGSAMFEYLKQKGGVMKFENVTINGREGTEAIYNPMIGNGIDSAVIRMVFDVEDKYYVFTANAPKDYKSKYEKVFEISLNSFVIDESLKEK